MRVCRRHGSIDAPEITWLQSSGDPLFDRDLFERRVRVPVGEPAEPGPRCDVWSAIARPGGSGPPPQVTTSAAVDPEAFAARRISGRKNVFPADDLKNAIRYSGVHAFTVPVQVCVDRVGQPATVTLLRSSGYTGYDMDLINAIAAWRYAPFTIDGKPAPACSVVELSYRQN